MTETLEEARASLQEKMQGNEIDGSIKFEVDGLGSIVIADGSVTISQIDTDCTLKGNLETFQQIFDGELSATTAFMSGRLTVEGSMGVAMQYNTILS